MFLEISQNLQENTCVRVSFLIKLQAKACNFIKKETVAHVFSCEFCKISSKHLFCRTHLVAASASTIFQILVLVNDVILWILGVVGLRFYNVFNDESKLTEFIQKTLYKYFVDKCLFKFNTQTIMMQGSTASWKQKILKKIKN